ncbi:AEC family transporter [Vibrio mediterranei]|uniref:AEC family transporter n=1 Tax=Vibrio mediterranei TaxID=689 RepID=UPI00148E7C74|nr:AEC family transporter [Vibrio mediterranei]NOI26661.1 AEC family transporter [Vibrio mediterranei]
MDSNAIIFKTVLLIFMSVIGWVAGKKIDIDPKGVSSILIYIIKTAVIFIGVVMAPSVSIIYLYYAFGAFLLCSMLAGLAYLASKLLWNDSKVNLFSFTGGTGNTGYFALPIILTMFTGETVAIAIFILIGVTVYEFSIGYYITARGNFDKRECIKKVVTLPIIYSAIAGLLVNASGVDISKDLVMFLNNFKGAYSVLGMMIIGLTLARYNLRFDKKFMLSAISWRHIIVPVVCIPLILSLGLNHEIIVVAMLMLGSPMAGNTVVLANQLEVHPEIAATTVMTSTLLAAITVPMNMHLINFL